LAADDGEFSLPFTTEPLPGSDPAMDWGKVIRDSRNTLEARRVALQAECKPQRAVAAGHEVQLPNEQSTVGKVAALVLAAGGAAKAGESTYFAGDTVVPVNMKVEGRKKPRTVDYSLKLGKNKVHKWLDFALNGQRGCVTGTTIIYAGKEYTLDEFRGDL